MIGKVFPKIHFPKWHLKCDLFNKNNGSVKQEMKLYLNGLLRSYTYIRIYFLLLTRNETVFKWSLRTIYKERFALL